VIVKKSVSKSASKPALKPELKNVSLDDKYNLGKKQVFISGSQAVVRLVLTQKERDRQAGLNTGGYVTGYRGSPISGLDHQMWRSEVQLKENDIVFSPGLNEDLAATALWGTQQAEMRGEGRFDGVFGVWYGKGPGVDRSGDVFRHANLAGTSKYGGVLALMGDDHTCESSTTAHQSEFHFLDVAIPVLNPAGVQEILDYGLYGYALSRYAGVWVGIKCVKDNIESTEVVDGRIDRVKIIEPKFALPEDGLNIRPNDHPIVQEARLHDYKRDAILAFVKANKINRMITSGGKNPKVGVITTGKSYLDVRLAMDDLGIDEVVANNLGLRLFKIGCVYPIGQDELMAFAKDLDLIIVVEEKRSLIEVQVREELYGTSHTPLCVGKKDEKGNWLFPIKGALDSNNIAVAIGERLLKFSPDSKLKKRVAHLKKAQQVLASTESVAERIPYFCAGCPHSTSTKIPEGARAYAGIGCHYMAQWMDRGTEGYTQMGAEGANWIGERHFSKRNHVFQNLGDGTYNHSGYLAIRAAVAAKARMTYKILFNDAVAMTGGQPNEGDLSVPGIAAQVAAAGVERVVIVTDEPDKYPATIHWPTGTTIHHRSELIPVQEDLATSSGVTVMIYDQTCATEKRRRRKRGTFPDPDKRIVINELVCEGCGDCGVQSNCVAVGAVTTEFGRKRQIEQSTCNKDFSCINGFCPSFVTVHGGKLKKGKGVINETPLDIPEPEIAEIDGTFGAIITGVGGTGVVTIGALIGMAAHLEGKGCGIIDMAGLAQKGGAVASHVRIAKSPEDISSIRIAASGADLVLGCDMVTAASAKVLASINPGHTTVVVNSHEKLSGEFTHNVDFSFPTKRIIQTIATRAGENKVSVVEAERLATALLGDGIATNMFMLGYAWQNGGLPLSRAALHKAIEMNGVAVEMNLAAFEWGRAAAHDVSALPASEKGRAEVLDHRHLSQGLDEIIQRRVKWLTDYQNSAYADKFSKAIERMQKAEAALGDDTGLSEQVARNLYKLMAIKDEYEVGRLFTNGEFARQLESQFDDYDRLEFHLAPPLFAKRDAKGQLIKKAYGPRMMKMFGLLARMRGLRGTLFDPFSYLAERKEELRLLKDYQAVIDLLVENLDAKNYTAGVALAAYPEKIRGFGHVKERAIALADRQRRELSASFLNQESIILEAAE